MASRQAALVLLLAAAAHAATEHGGSRWPPAETLGTPTTAPWPGVVYQLRLVGRDRWCASKSFLTSQSCDRRSRDGPLVLAEGSHGRSPAPFSQWGLVAAASDRPLVDPPATFSLGNWGRYDDRAEGWRRYGSRARCHYLLDSARGCRSSAVPYFSTAGGAWALERVAGTADQFRIVSQARASSGCTARYLGASSSDCHKGGAMGLFARPPLTRATAASTEHGRPGWRPAPPPLLAWQFLPLCRKQGARCTPGERLGCCRSSAAAADLQCVASTPAPGAPTVCAAPPQAPANGIRAEPGANSVKATLLPATPASGGSSVGVRYRLKLTQQALPGGGRRLHAALPSYQLTSDSNVFNVTPGMAADNGAVVGQLCGATWLVEGAWGNAAGWSPFQRYDSVAVAACCGTMGQACEILDSGESTCCPGPDPESWSDNNLACVEYNPDEDRPKNTVCTGKPEVPPNAISAGPINETSMFSRVKPPVSTGGSAYVFYSYQLSTDAGSYGFLKGEADVVIMERATRIFTCSGSICGNTNLIERLCGYTWALSVRVCSVANKCTDSQTVEGIQMPPCSCPIKRETCEVTEELPGPRGSCCTDHGRGYELSCVKESGEADARMVCATAPQPSSPQFFTVEEVSTPAPNEMAVKLWSAFDNGGTSYQQSYEATIHERPAGAKYSLASQELSMTFATGNTDLSGETIGPLCGKSWNITTTYINVVGPTAGDGDPFVVDMPPCPV